MPDGQAKRLAYMRSRAWARKRAEVRRRSGGRCERCHRRRAREVHHLTYARLYHEPLGDLIHLCRPCHVAAHKRAANGRFRRVLVALLMLGGILFYRPLTWIAHLLAG